MEIERLSFRTWEFVRADRPWACHDGRTHTTRGTPQPPWLAFAPRDRINAPLRGFRPRHGKLPAMIAIRRLRDIWTALAPIMATMFTADTVSPPHSSVFRHGHAVSHPIRRKRIFPERKVYGQGSHARNTCNTYSLAYKGKPRKKRLSPKQVNTLIHQCITFYKTFIFQYLSLWKSVFSRN